MLKFIKTMLFTTMTFCSSDVLKCFSMNNQ